MSAWVRDALSSSSRRICRRLPLPRYRGVRTTEIAKVAARGIGVVTGLMVAVADIREAEAIDRRADRAAVLAALASE